MNPPEVIPHNLMAHQLGHSGGAQMATHVGPETYAVDQQQHMAQQAHGSTDETHPHLVPSVSAPSEPTIAPTYDDIFPALPEMSETKSESEVPTTVGQQQQTAQWNKMKMKSSIVTQVFRVAPEERRYREINSRFGEQAEQAKICADIMSKTGANIEMSISKDGTLTFLITGKEEAVVQAKKMISTELQTQASASLPIPKEHHRFILGKSGKKLNELEQMTGTKIYVPRQNDASELIKILGTKEAIDKAVHEIQLISNEAASKTNERVSIPKIYHAFICGPFNTVLDKIQSETGAKINIPPPSVNKEEISITGEKDAVMNAKDRIMKIYEEKQKTCQTVCMEVRKQQHKYIVGPKGHTIQEIFAQTGVSVEMPSSDSNTETITLRGEQDKLGPALKVLYEKAHSEVDAEINVPSWYHKYILGPKGAKFQEISQDFQKVNVSFVSNEDKIKMHGPANELAKAKEVIMAVIKEVKSKICIEEIKVSSKYHRFIIGKNGANIKHIREETGAQIHIPDEQDGGDFIRVEGSAQSVEKAKHELDVIIKKLVEKENEVTRELNVEQRFHRQIIGTKGEKIREIRDKFNQVVIGFPEPGVKSDKVTIRGSKKDIDQCYKHLAQLNKELLENNFKAEVPIYKQFHKFIIGKEGATIKKIRDETNTKIELPAEGSESDVIIITGEKRNVEIAKDKIQAIQTELVNVVQVDIIIPAKYHNNIIGAKGRQIRHIMEECGNVTIRFPTEGSGSDKVSIRGPKESVVKAKQKLVELSNDQQVNNFSLEMKVKPEHHRFLIGKSGVNIRKVKEKTGARVFFPSEREESLADRETIVISGKREEVMKAKSMLEETIKDLDKIVEGEMRIEPKYHRHFVARRGAVLKQISDDLGGVSISFPKNKDDDRVILKGAKECVEEAKQRLSEKIKEYDEMVTIECVIDSQHHRSLMGARGSRVQAITHDHDVRIKFPERGERGEDGKYAVANGDMNGNNDGSEKNFNRSKDTIVIQGKKENCESAKQALMELIPVTIEFEVPFDYHRFIIGQKGREVRDLMETYDVSITVPPASVNSDFIKISGPKLNVEKAKKAILERVDKLDSEKQDRDAKSFSTSIHVKPIYHPKIIGRKGAVISKIREKFDVQIQFPELKRGNPSKETEDLITIVGYEKNALEAKDEILKLVDDLEKLVEEEVTIDSKVHRRLIGQKGRNIRRVMDQYHVDIRFPKENSSNADVVTIIGQPEDVDEAKDYLLNLAEEYMDDVEDQYTHPTRSRDHDNYRPGDGTRTGFVVKGGPWEHQQSVPDTSDAQEFPSFGGDSPALAAPVESNPDVPKSASKWGPKS